MPVSVGRDFDTDEIVIRIKRGTRSMGFARFLETAADGLENGKILPTNPDPTRSLTKAADEVRAIATKVRNHSA